MPVRSADAAEIDHLVLWHDAWHEANAPVLLNVLLML